jgi:hypothetical protein
MGSKHKRGDMVEVRSRDEILATLDAEARLDGMPFMPEMLAFCGRRIRVASRADKTCDTIDSYLSRRLHDTVHLEQSRCDGGGHGGCQAGCLLFWKEAWLKPVDGPEVGARASGPGCSASDLERAATREAEETDEVHFVCQATELVRASEPLAWWDLRQYLRELSSGNVGLLEMLRVCFFAALRASWAIGPGYGAKVWLYQRLQPLLGGPRFIFADGKLSKTPSETLGLQPGDAVRVRDGAAIVATLDKSNKNRGLGFDSEMLGFCGTEHVVKQRVEKIVDEKSGRMMKLPNDCVILEGVECRARCSANRLFCPRSIYPYWREIWLERLS